MALRGTTAGRLAGAALTALLLASAGRPSAAPAQQALRAPSGSRLEVPRDTLLRMLEETRAYGDTLVQDPDVLYYTGFSEAVTADDPSTAFPWNAIEVRSDSVARVATPGNLREGDRAYHAYAVARMESYRGRPRGGPTPSCEERMTREVEVLEAFARGWTVSRIYYGAPPYPPLDEIAFAHRRGHLAAYLATRGPRQLEDCAEAWREENADRVDAYRDWRRSEFLEPGEAPDPRASGAGDEARPSALADGERPRP